MKTISPSKNLFDFDLTPAKQVVSCDINGWMETQSKQEVPHTHRIRAKPPRSIKSITQSPQSNLAQLRAHRETILKSTGKKKIGKAEMNTAESSNCKQSPSLYSRFNSEGFFIKSLSKAKATKPIIQVSEFIVEEATLLKKIGEKPEDSRQKVKGAQLMKLSQMVGSSPKKGLNKLLLRCGNNVIKSGASEYQYRSLSSVNRKKSIIRH